MLCPSTHVHANLSKPTEQINNANAEMHKLFLIKKRLDVTAMSWKPLELRSRFHNFGSGEMGKVIEGIFLNNFVTFHATSSRNCCPSPFTQPQRKPGKGFRRFPAWEQKGFPGSLQTFPFMPEKTSSIYTSTSFLTTKRAFPLNVVIQV